jgi:hypothetical protein
MKKITFIIVLLAISVWSTGFAQDEAWETHTRGLLHQTVFNTGALGVQYNSFRSVNSGDDERKAFEWPGDSYFNYLNVDYWYYNANGAGLVMLCDTGKTGSRATCWINDAVANTTVGIDMIGCLGQGGSGTYRDGTGVHYWPGEVTKKTNYPLNNDGSWNSSYDPKEAEEIITSSVHTPYGITITRTSREWSYPGYDSFIIYDYEFKNTGMHFLGASGISPTHATDTISNIAADWVESFFPSYFYANSVVGDFTSAANKELARFDLRRYMTYVHSPDGRPNAANLAAWSTAGTYGGGLMAPASVGYMFLYYDYDHLMTNATSRFVGSVKTNVSEQLYAYDANNKFKQPWVVASTQANLIPTKITSHVNGSTSRYNIWNPLNESSSHDSLELNTHFPRKMVEYWYGRAHPNANFNYASPMVHSMALGPYILPPDESFHVVVAEVAGFGPGRKWDAKTYDWGGGTETTVTFDAMHPVPSWDSLITYPKNAATNTDNTPAISTTTNISAAAKVGNTYIPTYGLPAYIRDTNVVSIRDVADRCIQVYTGNTNVIKYDSTQYEPWGNTAATSVSNPVPTFPYAPSPANVATRTGGWNAAFKVPYPAPVVEAYRKGTTIISGLKWKNTIESLSGSTISPYIASGFKHYEVWRSSSSLGPWAVIDTVVKQDGRFYSAGVYTYADSLDHGVDKNGNTIQKAAFGATYYYTVVSVDSAGRKSGLTNMLSQKAGFGPASPLGKVYAVPNPFFLVSGSAGETMGSSKIQFYGLTKNSTIRIFSFSGQLVKTLHSDGAYMSIGWDLRNESLKKIASGVYYFTVEDNDTGSKAWNKFVVIH